MSGTACSSTQACPTRVALKGQAVRASAFISSGVNFVRVAAERGREFSENRPPHFLASAWPNFIYFLRQRRALHRLKSVGSTLARVCTGTCRSKTSSGFVATVGRRARPNALLCQGNKSNRSSQSRVASLRCRCGLKHQHQGKPFQNHILQLGRREEGASPALCFPIGRFFLRCNNIMRERVVRDGKP